MSQNKGELLVCIGFTLIMGGIVLLTLNTLDTADGFFFVFPFFFVGNMEPFGFLFLAVSIFVIIVFIYQAARLFRIGGPYVSAQIHYNECTQCNTQIPSDWEFCPKCGSRVNQNFTD